MTGQSLGDRVRAAREAKNLTQAALAKLVVKAGYKSMTQGGIGQIERRGHSEPKCIVQLAEALGVPARWLQIGGKSWPR